METKVGCRTPAQLRKRMFGSQLPYICPHHPLVMRENLIPGQIPCCLPDVLETTDDIRQLIDFASNVGSVTIIVKTDRGQQVYNQDTFYILLRLFHNGYIIDESRWANHAKIRLLWLVQQNPSDWRASLNFAFYEPNEIGVLQIMPPERGSLVDFEYFLASDEEDTPEKMRDWLEFLKTRDSDEFPGLINLAKKYGRNYWIEPLTQLWHQREVEEEARDKEY